MKKTCGNCGFYKAIPQLHGGGCSFYEAIPLTAEDGPFLGYPSAVETHSACDKWEPVGRSRHTRIVVTPTPEQIANLYGGKMPPLWLRTSFIEEASPYRDIDKVYLPIEAFGEPLDQFLAACHDGVPLVRDGGHTYAPASWIMRERPKLAGQIKMIVNRVLKSAAAGTSRRTASSEV